MIQFKITDKFADIMSTGLMVGLILGTPVFLISKCTYDDIRPSEQSLREQALQDSLERFNDSLQIENEKKKVAFVDSISKLQLLNFGIDVKHMTCYNSLDSEYLCRFTKNYDLGKLYRISCIMRTENVLIDCNTGSIEDISASIESVKKLETVEAPKPDTTKLADTNAMQN